jgi:hypothetical protein
MISLQNALWWRRADWNDQLVPRVYYEKKNAAANRAYWGWNEVPVNRASVSDESNWDAVMIKLPAAGCGGNGGVPFNGEQDTLSCMLHQYQVQLETQLDQWFNAGYLAESQDIVIAREYMDASTNYFRKFFCEAWTSPSGRYKIVFDDHGCTLVKPPGMNSIVV